MSLPRMLRERPVFSTLPFTTISLPVGKRENFCPLASTRSVRPSHSTFAEGSIFRSCLARSPANTKSPPVPLAPSAASAAGAVAAAAGVCARGRGEGVGSPSASGSGVGVAWSGRNQFRNCTSCTAGVASALRCARAGVQYACNPNANSSGAVARISSTRSRAAVNPLSCKSSVSL